MKKTFKMLLVLFLIGAWCVGSSGETEHTDENETEPAMIQTFTASDVTVIPGIGIYDFTTAKDIGELQQIQGMLPCTSEGVWYIVSIDGVEYYYGKYNQNISTCVVANPTACLYRNKLRAVRVLACNRTGRTNSKIELNSLK